MRLAKNKFQETIQTKAGHLELPEIAEPENGVEISVVEDDVLEDNVLEDIIIMSDGDSDKDQIIIPDVSDDDELDEFDKLDN